MKSGLGLTKARTPKSICNHSDDDLNFAHQAIPFGRNRRALASEHPLAQLDGYVDEAEICQSAILPEIIPKGSSLSQTDGSWAKVSNSKTISQILQ